MQDKIRAQLQNRIKEFLESGETGVLLLFQSLQPQQPRYLLFDKPRGEIRCDHFSQIPEFFRQVEQALEKNKFLAGYMSYELGYGLEPRLGLLAGQRSPESLAWLGIFSKPLAIDPAIIRALAKRQHSQGQKPYWLRPPQPGLDRKTYGRKLQCIHEKLAAGETYQVNFTFPLRTQVHGEKSALFWDLWRRQKAGYSAWVHGGGRCLLSLSPELFFERQGQSLITQPMKGTAARCSGRQADASSRRELADSVKNRAENVMIVDLLRNDLGKICQTGTVQVSKLFQVQTYPTLYQMTSTIGGKVLKTTTWQDLFRGLFPCGSVTGAPKIHTQQLIADLEPGCRGVYTGALGFMAPRQRAIFNVPIRTLEIQATSGEGTFGIGSGIVADSDPEQEWQECLLKAKFFSEQASSQHVLETLAWTPENGYRYLEEHIRRLSASAKYFGIPAKAAELRAALQEYAGKASWKSARRIRLLLSADGKARLENTVLARRNNKTLPAVAISRQPMDSGNLFLYHKTTLRQVYTLAWQQAQGRGLGDMLFTNEHGYLTESTIANLFIRKNGCWLTPPVSDGLLPGIERAVFLRQNPDSAKEVHLRRQDLLAAEDIFLCNSVRGFWKIRLV